VIPSNYLWIVNKLKMLSLLLLVHLDVDFNFSRHIQEFILVKF